MFDLSTNASCKCCGRNSNRSALARDRRRPRSSCLPLCAVGTTILLGGITEFCQANKNAAASSVRRDAFGNGGQVDPGLSDRNHVIIVRRNRSRRHEKDHDASIRSDKKSKLSKGESPLKVAKSSTSATTTTGTTASAVVTNVGDSAAEQNGGAGTNLRNRRRRHSLSTGVPGGEEGLGGTTPAQDTGGDVLAPSVPSPIPSNRPSFIPTMTLSNGPSRNPSDSPSTSPSFDPSVTFSMAPSRRPSSWPSMVPSSFPSLEPSVSSAPTSEEAPSSPPTTSVHPSTFPSEQPSIGPSSQPSFLPSNKPTVAASLTPSDMPSAQPSSTPSSDPSNVPSNIPSAPPSSPFPSSIPSHLPSVSLMPSWNPSRLPSLTPTSCLNYESCASPAEKNFNIQLLPLGGETDYDEDLLWAKQRWEEIIVNDLVDFPNSDGEINFLDGTGYSYSGSVDDVVIAYQFGEIDGLDGILGSAGPVLVRLNSRTPASGLMEFDNVDFQALYPPGSFAARYILVHEMGHVLGIGVTGPCFEECGVANGEASFEYTCQRAAAEYAKIVKCTDFAAGPLNLKLEDDGGEGTFCSHWEDDNFDHPDSSEMMTGFFDNSKNQPISRVTLGALEDMGYVVDYCAGEKYPLLDGEGDKLGTASNADAGAALRTESEPMSFSLKGRMKEPKIHYISEEEA